MLALVNNMCAVNSLTFGQQSGHLKSEIACSLQHPFHWQWLASLRLVEFTSSIHVLNRIVSPEQAVKFLSCL